MKVRKLLKKALPDVIDAGVDFWAYGVMLLEYYCLIFFSTLEIALLMQQVLEKDGAGDTLGALRALDQVRTTFRTDKFLVGHFKKRSYR